MMNRTLKKLTAICVVSLLSGCYNKATPEEEINVHYWTLTGEETCVKLSGIPHCFLNKHIAAAAFPGGSRAGILFYLPTDDPDLIDCNKQRYTLKGASYSYPHFSANVSEPAFSNGDTIEKYYWRIHESSVGETSIYPVRPLQYDIYFGEKCIKYSGIGTSYEMVCHGGEVNKNEPAYFFSCSKDGSVPYPGCRDKFVYKGLYYSPSYNKKCGAYREKIRNITINFIKKGRERAIAGVVNK